MISEHFSQFLNDLNYLLAVSNFSVGINSITNYKGYVYCSRFINSFKLCLHNRNTFYLTQDIDFFTQLTKLNSTLLTWFCEKQFKCLFSEILSFMTLICLWAFATIKTHKLGKNLKIQTIENIFDHLSKVLVQDIGKIV